MKILSELKSHNWMYAQQEDHLKVSPDEFRKILEKSGAEKWAYIKHDKDNGIEPHFHVILHYKNASRLSNVANLFKDKEEYVERWDERWDNACGYLLHMTKNSVEDGKYPYNIMVSIHITLMKLRQVLILRKKLTRFKKEFMVQRILLR